MNSAQTPSPTIILQKGPSFLNKNVLIIIVLLVLVSLGSYYLGIVKPLPLPGTGVLVYEKDLPFSLAIIRNPLIDQWSAGVTGKLVKKDQNSITIQDNQGNSMNIPLRLTPNDPIVWTKFFIVKKDNQPASKLVSLDEIPLGVILKGGIFIMPEPNNKNRIVGNQFVYDQHSQELK